MYAFVSDTIDAYLLAPMWQAQAKYAKAESLPNLSSFDSISAAVQAERIALLTSALAQPRLASRAPLPRDLHAVRGYRSTAQSRRSFVNFSPPPSPRGFVDRELGSQFEPGYPIYQKAPHHTGKYHNRRFPSSPRHAHIPDADGVTPAPLLPSFLRDIVQSPTLLLASTSSSVSPLEEYEESLPLETSFANNLLTAAPISTIWRLDEKETTVAMESLQVAV
ncbi:hypothetical protein B0H14DRAFT_3779378 [Mycena olivaceomarginata]|nr:hypothetical protein B0H14DRAFT_3779378 [Mycena olivaceomarginata]